MMIFILASGYLLTVYLLLALAKRTGNKTAPTRNSQPVEKNQQKLSVSAKVTQATSLH